MWPTESGNASDFTYTEHKANTEFSVSRESILDTMKQIEWLSYEVDPEWSRFCSFGPEDIGGVWEKIGAIRKRPRYSMAMVSSAMMAAINKRAESEVLYGSRGHDSVVFGIKCIESPFLSAGSGFLFANV